MCHVPALILLPPFAHPLWTFPKHHSILSCLLLHILFYTTLIRYLASATKTTVEVVLNSVSSAPASSDPQTCFPPPYWTVPLGVTLLILIQHALNCLIFPPTPTPAPSPPSDHHSSCHLLVPVLFDTCISLSISNLLPSPVTSAFSMSLDPSIPFIHSAPLYCTPAKGQALSTLYAPPWTSVCISIDDKNNFLPEIPTFCFFPPHSVLCYCQINVPRL